MKKKINRAFTIVCMVGILLMPVTLLPGCKSSPQQIAYQAAGATSVSVEAALVTYNTFAKAGKTTVTQNQKVKAAYLNYQAAFAVAADAGAVYAASGSTNSAAAFQQATLNSAATITDILNLIQSFGIQLN